MNIKLETQKKQNREIISLQTKLKQSEEEKSALSKQVIEEKNALEDSKKKSKKVLEDVKTQCKSKVTELQERLYWTKDNFESQVRKEMETVHERDTKSIIRKHKAEVMQLKKQLQDLKSVHEALEAEFECVCGELESEKIENKEHLGAIDTLLTEDKPEAPSTGKKRTHEHVDKSSRKYVEEIKILLQSVAIEDIDLTPEQRRGKCTEDLAGHKVPPRMKVMYEGMANKWSYSKQVSTHHEAIAEARETYLNEGVIPELPCGQMGSEEALAVLARLSFPDDNESNESRTAQTTLGGLGSKLSNIPNSLRMTDTCEKKPTVIISDQEPIRRPHDYVTKIKEYRPKLNKEDLQSVDDLLKRHNNLAEVAEKTQMKMIHLTNQSLGLVIIGKNIEFSFCLVPFFRNSLFPS